MESNSLINSQPINSPLAESDMSLTHFSGWSRSDKIAFSSFIVGIIGTISIVLAFVSIWYSHKQERRELRQRIENEVNENLNRRMPVVDQNENQTVE